MAARKNNYAMEKIVSKSKGAKKKEKKGGSKKFWFMGYDCQNKQVQIFAYPHAPNWNIAQFFT